MCNDRHHWTVQESWGASWCYWAWNLACKTSLRLGVSSRHRRENVHSRSDVCTGSNEHVNHGLHDDLLQVGSVDSFPSLHIKLDGCIVWNAHNTVFGLKRICWRAAKNSTAWQPTTAHLLVMVTNNKHHSIFCSILKHRTLAKNAIPPTSQKIWGSECTGQGSDFELIAMVKMETRHLVEWSFGRSGDL